MDLQAYIEECNWTTYAYNGSLAVSPNCPILEFFADLIDAADNFDVYDGIAHAMRTATVLATHVKAPYAVIYWPTIPYANGKHNVGEDKET